MTDVNAAFAAEKIAQLASEYDRASGIGQNRNRDLRLGTLRARVAKGEMTERPGANGTIVFQDITNGWDANETWTVQAAAAINENVIVQANHGLETKANGDVALYLNGENGPAWHGLGQVIPGGLSDSAAVLKAGGLDWIVEKREMMYGHRITDPTTGEERSMLRTVPNMFTTVRTDTGASLGTVGTIYTPLQNFEAYGMLEELVGMGMVCESAGVLNGGSRVFVTAEIPDAVTVDPNGIADKTRQFLAILNSHDGKSPLMGLITPWRILCGNTHRFALNGAKKTPYKWVVRHTKTAKDKMAEARRALGLTVQYYGEFAAEETELVHSDFGHNELDALIKEIWEVKLGADGTPSKRSETIATNRTEKVHELFDMESARVGRNAFAAENAITGYVDHYAELRPRGDLKGNRLAALGQALLSETFDEPKRSAHTALLLKVRGK